VAYTTIIEKSDEAKEEWRKQVSNQIADFLPGIKEQLKTKLSDAQLSESFKIWAIGLGDVKKAGANAKLETLAYDTRHWHHQVFINEKARVYAESRFVKGGKPRVYQLSISALAGKIDKAIDLLDKFDDEVRFIKVPPFQIHAFWLVKSEKVYLLNAPWDFDSLRPYLRKFLHKDRFIELLQKEIAALDKKCLKHKS
jgi:hypothetical protein